MGACFVLCDSLISVHHVHQVHHLFNMATNKPRITVTLEPRTYELLKALQESGGQSMSSFIAEILEQSEPMLERMAVMFQRFREQQEAQAAEISGRLLDVQKQFEPMLETMLDQWDLFMTDSGSEEAGGPHPTNRGVTDVQPIDNKQTSKKTRGVKHS